MRILWIYNHRAEREYDCWLHLEFAKKLSQYHEVVVYGRNVEKFYPDLCKFVWNKGICLSDIKQSFDFDVIIADTKNRMFDYYRPSLFPYDDRPEERGWSLLPKDFVSWNKTPKICLEEDYQYEENTEWYQQMTFDLLLHRHRSNWLRTQNDNIKSEWFPFSVDNEIFKPTDIKRENKVLFAMNYTHEVYVDRREARRLLLKEGLLNDCGANAKFQMYIRLLQSHNVVLNGSGMYEITPAKIFEIISSGAVLLTDDSPKPGVDILFPDCYVKYKKDCSDIVEITKNLLGDEEYIKSLSDKGLQIIKNKHTHEKRIEDLMLHINAL